MTQIALHKNAASIASDMEFYRTDRWDKHNQIRPADDILSLTPDSATLGFPLAAGHVGNFLYPMPRGSFERIYIGPSMPLFIHHWGVSFLVQLLRLLAPEGAIILPVHPEGRGHEKGWWSRTSLESSFQNRTGWRGISNISAENDGVMSLRVGCRWPRHTPSTIEWFFQERGSLILNDLINPDHTHSSVNGTSAPAHLFLTLAREAWAVSYRSAVLEAIALDTFGKRAFSLAQAAAGSALLTTELLLSPRLHLREAYVQLGTEPARLAAHALTRHFAAELQGRLHCTDAEPQPADLVLLPDIAGHTPNAKERVTRAWSQVKPGGALVLLEDWSQAPASALLACSERLPQREGMRFYAADATTALAVHPADTAFCAVRRSE